MEITYEEFINNILETRGRFACGDEYCERHHIIPKCMDGTDDKNNLIDLYAREHFEAHKLLALENTNNSSLQFAWWNMCQRRTDDGLRYIPTAEEYEEARKAHSKNMSKLLSGRVFSEETRQKMRENHANFKGENHYLYGKRMPDETKQKLRKARLGKRLSEETKRKISESQKGKIISEEQKEKLRLANTGKKRTNETKEKLSKLAKERFSVPENNPFYGKHHSKESREKIGAAQKGKTISEEHRKKLSELFKGEGAPMYGKHHTEETKENLRIKAKERLSDPKNRTNCKIICQYDLKMNFINIWNCKNDAAKSVEVHPSALSMCCLGARKKAGNFIWRYLYDQTRKDGTVVPGAITLGLIAEEEALRILKNKDGMVI